MEAVVLQNELDMEIEFWHDFIDGVEDNFKSEDDQQKRESYVEILEIAREKLYVTLAHKGNCPAACDKPDCRN
jgi:xylose isomerase